MNAPECLLCESRRSALIRVAASCVTIDGDFVECGVYKGGSAFILSQILDFCVSYKRLHLFDSFAGCSAPDEADGGCLSKGCLRADEIEVRNTFGPDERIQFHAGYVENTVGELPSAIAFAHIDLDLYGPTKLCLASVAQRLQPGGAMVVDDYSPRWPGCKAAVDEFLCGGLLKGWKPKLIPGFPDNAIILTR